MKVIHKTQTPEYGLDIVTERKKRVAEMTMKGYTANEILAEFKKEGFLNPNTNELWSESLIHKDVQYWKKQWRERARVSVEKKRAEEVAKLEFIRNEALRKGKLGDATKASSLLHSLLGLSAPVKTETKAVDSWDKLFDLAKDEENKEEEKAEEHDDEEEKLRVVQ